MKIGITGAIELLFDGWHPQCFCFVTPIMASEDELAKEFEAYSRGETYTPKGEEVTEYPSAFKKWVKANESNIEAARKRGTEPYFIRNNASVIDDILNSKAAGTRAQTIAERAAARHAARRQAEEEAIRNDWQERQFKDINDALAKAGVTYNEVQTFAAPITEQEIITRLGGGDLTDGSCASLALAYAGNKGGLDVLDFRDGMSRSKFSERITLKQITQKVGGINIEGYNDFETAKQLFVNVAEGKEYVLTIASHAAIIRRTANGIEYLELQSYTDNGFKPWTDKTLRKRFGGKRSRTWRHTKYKLDANLIDVELLIGNAGFKKCLAI